MCSQQENSDDRESFTPHLPIEIWIRVKFVYNKNYIYCTTLKILKHRKPSALIADLC